MAISMDRTTSIGLWKYGQEFAIAGRIVWEQTGQKDGPTPAYYLLAHSIELVLKGYLRGRGATLANLHDQGHDLDKLLKAVDARGLNLFCELSEEHRNAIAIINWHYKKKELEYIVSGFKQYPRFELLLRTAEHLVKSLREICSATVNRHR